MKTFLLTIWTTNFHHIGQLQNRLNQEIRHPTKLMVTYQRQDVQCRPLFSCRFLHRNICCVCVYEVSTVFVSMLTGRLLNYIRSHNVLHEWSRFCFDLLRSSVQLFVSSVSDLLFSLKHWFDIGVDIYFIFALFTYSQTLASIPMYFNDDFLFVDLLYPLYQQQSFQQ